MVHGYAVMANDKRFVYPCSSIQPFPIIFSKLLAKVRDPPRGKTKNKKIKNEAKTYFSYVQDKQLLLSSHHASLYYKIPPLHPIHWYFPGIILFFPFMKSIINIFSPFIKAFHETRQWFKWLIIYFRSSNFRCICHLKFNNHSPRKINFNRDLL